MAEEQRYTFSGYVRDQRHRGVAGIRCEVWDKDWLSANDLLAADETGPDGRYATECRAARCQGIVGKDRPDVFIRCYSAGRWIADTESSVRPNISYGETEIHVDVRRIYCRVCFDGSESTGICAVRVCLRNVDTGDIYEGVTDGGGQCAIAVAPGEYEVLGNDYVTIEWKTASDDIKAAAAAAFNAYGPTLKVARCEPQRVNTSDSNDTFELCCQPMGGSESGEPDSSQKRIEELLSEVAALMPTSFDATGGGVRTSHAGLAEVAASPRRAVDNVLMEVIGRQLKTNDPHAFVASLSRAFTLEEEDGKTRFKWTPRTYAVQSELGAALTGAQASLHHQAQLILNDALPILDGLYPLKSDADEQNVEAVRAIVRTELIEVVDELGFEGGPRAQRVDGLFQALTMQLDRLRYDFGLITRQINTVEEEQNLTNFLVIYDYVNALSTTWERFRAKQDTFLGTQLYSLVAGALNRVRIGQRDDPRYGRGFSRGRRSAKRSALSCRVGRC